MVKWDVPWAERAGFVESADVPEAISGKSKANVLDIARRKFL